MIIRKPYALLIKYFKIIHIILFILMTFMVFKLRSIYFFFKNYLITGTFLNVSNLSSKYIGIPIILISIILIALLLLIFLLMKNKKKPVLYYLLAVIFYFFTFISLLFLTSIFNTLEYSSFSNQVLVLLRDLTMILYYFNFIFLLVSFVRGFGFNIKKFNFQKDLQELDITEADREEIELNSSIDYNNVLNFARRKKRNFKYYLKENSYILTVFGVVLCLLSIAYFTLNRLVFNKIYKENETFLINDLEIKVLSTYHTNLTKNGDVIKANYEYIIINFNVFNNLDNDMKLNIENTRLNINNKYYYPKNSSYFKDLGTIYKNQTILSKNEYNYLLIFEINKEDLKEKAILEFYYGQRNSGTSINFYYRNIRLNIKDFKKKDLGIYDLNKEIDLKETYFSDNKFNISKYEILDIENYKYTKCNNQNGDCVEYSASVVPKLGSVLLKFEYSLTNKFDIFNYVNLEYMLNNKIYNLNNSKIKNVTPSNYPENFILLEVNKELQEAPKINLIFNIRETKFKIKVREV